MPILKPTAGVDAEEMHGFLPPYLPDSPNSFLFPPSHRASLPPGISQQTIELPRPYRPSLSASDRH
ncbi:hypothetical protein E2C01_021200 [Portunus trituberculatus]|uniref:Uncharacterized protein n=1 Tax=Portunus trituberculatus TaxID=210409 RepID=A0A5B7E3T0_PORTR|nr:hypothetical protein [Portunus trituberculatus]